jgi:hypothetical protein
LKAAGNGVLHRTPCFLFRCLHSLSRLLLPTGLCFSDALPVAAHAANAAMAKAERMIIEMQHQQQEQQQQHQDQHFIIAELQERLNRALHAAATG